MMHERWQPHWRWLWVLAAATAGCEGSVPDDVFLGAEATGALVFVKAERSATLNERVAGNLYILTPISPHGHVQALTTFEDAAVSDPCVSFDGERILFSMDPAGPEPRNIYEIGVDGSGLRQVTSGGGDDFDPIYLADERVLFTSNRARERDEYNTALKEVLYVVDADGSNLRRISFNLSDDFDPFLLSTGRVAYTRWEHHGTSNRFPLAQVNPDGTGFFMLFGPHSRNLFHSQETRDGRFIGIASSRVNGDAGRVVIMSIAQDDPEAMTATNYSVLTPDIDLEGPPFPTGAFKHPNILPDTDRERRFVVSYSLPHAIEAQDDFALYTFAVSDEGGAERMVDLRLLYNDPRTDELDACLIAPRQVPPLIPDTVEEGVASGVFVGRDVYARSPDGQEQPERGSVGEIMVVEGIPTTDATRGMAISATEFERKRILGYAPVQADGSFAIKVPADVPISIHSLDPEGRTRVFQRTWVYARPGERRTNCFGCHAPRDGLPTNENPIALSVEPTDLVVPVAERRVVNFADQVGPIVQTKCTPCHVPTIVPAAARNPGQASAEPDTLPPPAGLDLRMEVDPTVDERFAIAYVSLVGTEMTSGSEAVRVPFSRQSPLIDRLMAPGTTAHPADEDPAYALSPPEIEMFIKWIDLGGQYR